MGAGMDDAQRYAVRQHIAAMIDYPSVYMGGPSTGAVRTAVRIIKMLEAEGVLVSSARIESDAVQVRTWRTAPWDDPISR